MLQCFQCVSASNKWTVEMLPISLKMVKFHIRLVVLSSIIVFSISTASPIYDSVDSEKDAAPIYDNVDFETDDDVGEYGKYFEGDMVLSVSQQQALENSYARNGLVDEDQRWPNHTVVYHINEEDFDEEQISKIMNAMAEIANHSCLIFRPRASEDEHAVVIEGSNDGCSAAVGYVPPGDDQEQTISLARGCFRHGSLVHEMLHTLGFRHMQSTHDRDDYVTVVWDNIQPEYAYNFLKYGNDSVTNLGVPYDYNSVMHYTRKAYSSNGKDTIIPLKENVNIGQRVGLSHGDIMKLNRMYCLKNKTDDEEDTYT
ncbi:unnamed protein product [Spodoptera littoralis]|uniref:Metalloendopeptidase n=1 Tax=Spodoptera littoralis TaxID=7109 RepID=A0A9P0IE59_SPOLI|nr:unnamed protein product [Spodoptera littoralis]CAH1643530.1 unnamed protein product [Spodoptera littoralis]